MRKRTSLNFVPWVPLHFSLVPGLVMCNCVSVYLGMRIGYVYICIGMHLFIFLCVSVVLTGMPSPISRWGRLLLISPEYCSFRTGHSQCSLPQLSPYSTLATPWEASQGHGDSLVLRRSCSSEMAMGSELKHTSLALSFFSTMWWQGLICESPSLEQFWV